VSTRIALVLLLLTAPVLAQSAADKGTTEPDHYPELTQAEVPLYPPIALTAHISGTVEVQVTVENGSVVDAHVRSVDIHIADPENRTVYGAQAKARVGPMLSKPSLANVKTWRFKPEGRTTFVAKYVYRIEGEQTSVPENPKVELDLPSLVTVTAKPLKPTCSDCGADISGKPVTH